MKPANLRILLAVALLTVAAGSATAEPKIDEDDVVVTRAYILGGYIPKFWLDRGDPFNPESEEKVREYEDGIQSLLKQLGITAKNVEFDPGRHTLFLTDTPRNLRQHEFGLRMLFQPELHLPQIESETGKLTDPEIFEGDKLYGVTLLQGVTLRAFHGEVRKLEYELEILPAGHEEKKLIEVRLASAKAYRKAAVELYLESVRKEKELIEKWRSEQPSDGEDDGPGD